MNETPVLIVGGGPVGLTLALALSRQGVRSTVVNDRKETTRHPKLDVVNCRSMEIFRQLGLDEKIRAAGNPLDANQYSAIAASVKGPVYTVMRERHLIYQPVETARTLIRECTDGSLPLESMQRIAQMHLEPVLLAEARADPNIDVRFGARLFGFEQDATGVTALVHDVDTRAQQHHRARYLIGCDGPSSRVRNFLNIDYDGTRDLMGELFIIHLRSKAIAGLFPNGQPYWHTWLSRPGFSGLLVSPDASRDDYVLHRPFGPRPGESLEDIVDAALGTQVPYDIVQSGPWRPQFLVAKSFGRHRVFLAGDATHQYMPTGGLGMNTGVTEAHNLAWKLAATLAGWGGPKLLPSYEAERLPVARRNREHVKKCAAAAFESQFQTSAAVLAPGAVGEAARALVAREFEARTSRLYESLGAELGYRYGDSPIIAREEGREPPCDEVAYLPTTWPGARLPSAFRDDGQAVFDLLDASGFTLLAASSARNEAERLTLAAREAGVPLRQVLLEEPRLRQLYERPLVLVRPDQHVCFRGETLPSEPRRLIDLIRGAA
ncbi:FAD-dependent monooxygenase [Myxococcus sp. K15C18031901]|uniref:FAD-dependent monooxygenase n=1 Tax=Myxococcus dinghuensis TaxID=2906761 RepID=UPI0020A73C3A|nr:FAD-dependent monooxygenase [Myxococcus dinghuensis]MCP3103392.1 FAD-dependent monooxygenase [Myxococcus dinghuensis]